MRRKACKDGQGRSNLRRWAIDTKGGGCGVASSTAQDARTEILLYPLNAKLIYSLAVITYYYNLVYRDVVVLSSLVLFTK